MEQRYRTRSPAPDSYKVLRGTTLGGPHSQVVWTTNTSYANGGLSSSTDSHYVVVACNPTSGFSHS